MSKLTHQKLTRHARAASEMTQPVFAVALGVSKAMIVSLELGRVQASERLLAKMSIVSGIDALSGTGDKTSKEAVEEEYLRRKLLEIQP